MAGEIDVVVEGEDLTDPEVVAWMRDYQAGAAQALRLLGQERLRHAPTLCPALSLPDLFRTADAADDAARAIRGLLDAVPPYFSQAVITRRPQDGEPRVRDPADAARRASSR